METYEQKLKKALMKKALGYQTREIVYEYSVGQNGEEQSNKKKVTKKQVPPDLSCLKLLLDDPLVPDFATLDDDDLERQRQKILQLIKEEENAD